MNIFTTLAQLLVLFPLVSAVAVLGVQMPRGGAIPDDAISPAPDLSHDRHEHEASSVTTSSATNSQVERILQSQWERHRRWAKIAKSRRRKIEAGRISKLVLVSTGAAAQVAATQLPVQYKSAVSLFGGFCVGAAAYVKNNILRDQDIMSMVTSYSTSQAIKAEVYKFRAHVTPYGEFKTNPDGALEILRERCNIISDSANDDKFFLTLPDSKAVPGPLDTIDAYLDNRLDRQMTHFYIKKGRKMMKRANFCGVCENVLLGLGTIAGVGGTAAAQLPTGVQQVLTGLSGWGGAFTAASTAFANHLAKQKFNDIAREYFEAAEDLQELKDTWPSKATESGSPDWENHVTKSEDVIQSTLEDWAKAASGKKELKLLKLQKPKSVKKDVAGMVWNPDIVCGTDESGFYPASARMQWLVDNESMTQKDAQNKVMKEFPDHF